MKEWLHTKDPAQEGIALMPFPLHRAPAESTTVLTAQIPDRIVDRILAEAAETDRTKSYVIRKILVTYYDAADAAGVGRTAAT
jgi:hypothetical protein